MRVLHVFKTFWPDTFGGIERTIDTIARATASHGIDSEVLSLSRKPRNDPGAFNGYRTTKARLDVEIASTGFSREAFSVYREAASRADIVHYHFPWPFMDVLHLSVRHGLPSIVTYHSDVVRQSWLNLLYTPLMRRFLRSMDAIVATSPNYRNSSRVLARYPGKTHVIPIGLDPSAYPTPETACLEAIRREYPDGFFFFVGVPRYYKGLDSLVEASRISGRPVIVAGGAERSASANVHFIGAIDEAEKVALLQACTAFVFPSNQRSEAYGLALLEAAMLGRPMISCEIGTGTSYINIDGETGRVVPPDDPNALAAAMEEIAHDGELAARWGVAGRTRFLQKFTAERMGAAYTSLYFEIGAAGGTRSPNARAGEVKRAGAGLSSRPRCAIPP
jgi:rhamnosyl/mannosyltransferase